MGINVMIWKTIKDFENYEVSDTGLVRSIERTTYKKNGAKHYTRPSRILKFGYTTDGYPLVVLCKDGKMNSKRVHRLVLETFEPVDDKKLQVNHIDYDKTNNHLSNLEWCTSRENSIHRGNKINKASKFTGLYFGKNQKRWYARIKINGRTVSLGGFEKEEDAAQAYLNKLSEI